MLISVNDFFMIKLLFFYFFISDAVEMENVWKCCNKVKLSSAPTFSDGAPNFFINEYQSD